MHNNNNNNLFSYRFVVLAFDEMKIREDLVFDKVTGDITGFVDYGDESLNVQFNELQQKCKRLSQDKREVATHMMTMMVRRLTFHLNQPIAQFATTGKHKIQLLLLMDHFRSIS